MRNLPQLLLGSGERLSHLLRRADQLRLQGALLLIQLKSRATTVKASTDDRQGRARNTAQYSHVKDTEISICMAECFGENKINVYVCHMFRSRYTL